MIKIKEVAIVGKLNSQLNMIRCWFPSATAAVVED